MTGPRPPPGFSDTYGCLASSAQHPHGPVLVPPGTYKITNTVTVPLNVSLVGAGRNATLFWYTGSSCAISAGNPAARTDTSSDMTGILADFSVSGNDLSIAGSVGIQ